MNQKLLSSVTAALVLTTLCARSSGHASQAKKVGIQAGFSFNQQTKIITDQAMLEAPIKSSSEAVQHSGSPTVSSELLLAEVVKVGTPQAQAPSEVAEEAVAKVQAHSIGTRKAATLYIRNIPILTFLETSSSNTNAVQAGAVNSRKVAASDTSVKLALPGEKQGIPKNPGQLGNPMRDDPVWRASAVAAKLNQLYRNNALDADKIAVFWAGKQSTTGAVQSHYIIKVSDAPLVTLNANTRLPDTTRDLEEDALQVTNRLRRLLGNASPLQAVAGKPKKPKPQFTALKNLQERIQGLASWYGPGFHGNLSASGEVFNQYALTAAHRYLPFGTQVRVTNLNNGRSVVVKINDRGPYVGNRVIDLSRGAAEVLGVIGSGIAPVRLEILGR